MPNFPNSILVLGAGELGTAVLESLASRIRQIHNTTSPPPTLSILLRTPTKHPHLQSLDITPIPGDISTESHASLVTKFTSFDLIISCTGMNAPPGTQAKITRAILSARVKWYIPWQFGLDYDAIGRGSSQELFTEQLDVRDMLRSQTGTAWTIVSTGVFMSFLLGGEEGGFGVVSEGAGVVRALGSWESRVAVTDVGDVGRMVGEVVLGMGVEEQVMDRVLHVAGDIISYEEIARTVEEVRGEEVRRELWTVDWLREDLARDPEDGMKKYRVVFAEGKGVA